MNGVFEGGGAKGLLYVGAVEACEKAGLTFKAVAGSSAGAITAMLVACGYTADELKDEIPNAFKALGHPVRALAFLPRKSLLDPSRLRKWLGDALARKLTEQANGERTFQSNATFENLRAVTDITLYVVSMDLASGQPIVFSPDLTPHMQVADAVVASSSIPVAFPAQRILLEDGIHRIVDGGVWANYPSFVFLDDDFRAFHGLPRRDLAAERDTIGFILDDRPADVVLKPGVQPRPLPHTTFPSDFGSAERKLGVLGSLLASPLTRALSLALPVLFIGIGFSWFRREIQADLPIIRDLFPNALEDVVLLMLVAVFAGLVVQSLLIAIGTLRLGRSVTDEGLVGATTAVGVGPNVPYWVGWVSSAQTDEPTEGPRHVAVRLMVPAGLETMSTHLGDDVRRVALETGFHTTMRALSRVYKDVSYDQPPPPPPPPPEAPKAIHPVTIVLFWAIAGLAFFFIALELITETADGNTGWWTLPILVVLALVMLWFHATSRARSASANQGLFGRLPRPVLLTICVLSALAGLIFLAVQLDEALSRELSISERMRAERIEATVIGEVTDDGVERVQVDLGTEQLPTYTGESEPGDISQCGEICYDDLDSENIVPCGEFCLSFLSDEEWSPGKPVDVRFDANDGVAFLDQDRWDQVGVDASLFLLLALLLRLSARSWRVYRWKRRDPVTLDLRTPTEPPAPPSSAPAAATAGRSAPPSPDIQRF